MHSLCSMAGTRKLHSSETLVNEYGSAMAGVVRPYTYQSRTFVTLERFSNSGELSSVRAVLTHLAKYWFH